MISNCANKSKCSFHCSLIGASPCSARLSRLTSKNLHFSTIFFQVDLIMNRAMILVFVVTFACFYFIVINRFSPPCQRAKACMASNCFVFNFNCNNSSKEYKKKKKNGTQSEQKPAGGLS